MTTDSRTGAAALSALRRSMLWILAFGVFVGACVLAFTRTQPKTYKATASVQITPGTTSPYLTDVQSVSNLYLALAQTSPVLASAGSTVGLTEKQFSALAAAAAEPEVSIVDLSTTARQPSQAATYANAYAQAFVAYVATFQGQAVQKALQPIAAKIAAVETQLATARTPALIQGLESSLQTLAGPAGAGRCRSRDSARLVEPPQPPTAPYTPRPTRSAAVAFLIAIVLASIAVVLRARGVDRYSSLDDATADLGLPLLAAIPLGDGSDPSVREAFRALRVNLSFDQRASAGDRIAERTLAGTPAGSDAPPLGGRGGEDISSSNIDPRDQPVLKSAMARGQGTDATARVILVTGSEVGAGKSYVSANLGAPSPRVTNAFCSWTATLQATVHERSRSTATRA